MSVRIQLIILGALVAVLGTVGYLQYGRSKPPEAVAPSRPHARGAVAPTAGGAEAATQAEGPSVADLRDLADWFNLRQPSAIGPAGENAGGQVLGLAPETHPAAPATTGAEPAQIPPMVEPGPLAGIIRVANGAAKAIFDGELYPIGARIRGTNFILVSVDEDSVTLKGSDGRVIHRPWHD